MTHAVLLHPECVALGGDVVVGTLLSQMVYWSLPGKPQMIMRHGVHWIAKTRAEWMAETGLTLNQYRRAMVVLKTRQLIEVRVMRRSGIAQSHVRLLQPLALYCRLSGNHPTGWVETTQPKRLYKYPHRSTFSTATEERSRDSDLANGIANQDSPVRGPSTEGEEHREQEEGSTEQERKEVREEDNTTRRGWMMKAEDVLKAHAAASTGSLGAYWKSRCALVSQDYQHPLTAKQLAQLKQLSKYLGDRTKPVIAYAVEHWWKFASRAGASAGCSFPADPHIGFLLKHHAVAVNLLYPAEVPEAPPPMEGGLVQLVAPKVEDHPVHTVSSQELTELLDGLKSP